MSGYLTFLIVIAVLISIELGLRLLGSSMMILVTLVKKLNEYKTLYPRWFAFKTVSTFISIILIVLGWCIMFKLPGALEGYSTFTNILFLIIFSVASLLGIVGFIWSKTNDTTNMPPQPVFLNIWDRIKYFFVDIPTWLFTNDVGPNVFKGIIGISIFFALMIGLIILLIKFPVLSKGIFFVLQIALTLGVLTFIYSLLKNNPQFMELIADSFIFRFLYNIIFAIPCLLYSIITGIYVDVKSTPKYIYMILAIEAVIILFYIASLFSKNLQEFIYDKIFLEKTDLYYAKQSALKELVIKLQEKKDKLNKLTRPYSTLDAFTNNFKELWERISIPKEKRKFKKPSTNAPIGLTTDNWEEIVQYKLYLKKKPDNSEKLRELLKNSGFGSVSDPSYNKHIINDADKAFSYIQTNGLNITNLIEEISNLEKTINNITKSNDSPGRGTFKDPSANKIIDNGGEYTIEDSKILLGQPQYLDKKINIGTFDNLITPSSNSLYNQQYGISAWIYLHEQPTNFRLSSTTFTPILDYAGNPTISYNLEKHMFRITIRDSSKKYLINNEKVIYKTNRLPMQRWNNIVINFNGGTLDIFINGMLVSSEEQMVPYMKHDTIYSGDKNGVSGGICNITYFSSPISKKHINILYNTLKDKNPPII